MDIREKLNDIALLLSEKGNDEAKKIALIVSASLVANSVGMMGDLFDSATRVHHEVMRRMGEVK